MPAPSAATMSSVSTSPRLCGSIRSVTLFSLPAPVDSAEFSFHTPNASLAHEVAPIKRSTAARMCPQCGKNT